MRSRELSVTPLDPRGSTLEAWRALTERCPDATAMARPEWSLSWHEHLGGNAVPALFGAWLDGALVGLAPLVREPDGRLVAPGGDVTDYFGIIALPELGHAVASALVAHLAAGGERCELRGVEACSPLLALGVDVREQDVCPYLPIPAHARSMADVVPAGFAKRLAYAWRAAHRAGRVELSWADASDVSARLETLFALHTAWWQARGERGVLHDDAVRAHWRAAAPPLARAGWLWIVELTLDGAPIASAIAFAHHRRVLYYLGGADPRAASLSPGRLAIAALLERAIAEGASELDFLRGVEPYKYAFGARNRSTYTLRIGARV